jgi:NADH-quinone oxidoreductase subunit F
MNTTRMIVGLGSCGIAAGGREIHQHLEAEIKRLGASGQIELAITACTGMCYNEPLVEIVSPFEKRRIFGRVTKEKADRILHHIVSQAPLIDEPISDNEFSAPQKKIVLRNCGEIDPESIDEYIARRGYEALKKARAMAPDELIELIKRSGLRGRGGAGFSTGLKWQFAAKNSGEKKYIICNADEGDPGAFMDRSTLEGDPHSILEGMLIAAHATGATHGYIYCRAEYPLAVARLRRAIEQAEKRGFLGSIHLALKEGAGAFVCGEETALIASIEGQRGMPRKRPPYPAERGLFNSPTNINNVETFANIPWIILNGAEAFAAIGTETSKGTKVFALAGKIKRGGLVEVPMGMTIRNIVENIAGGSNTGRPLKAVQLGGPSGGCIPASLFDTPVDYEAVTKTGAIMGSGGMLVMDETTCMVDVARFFLEFTRLESCGKCTFCRVGTQRMLEILQRITKGEGQLSDLTQLEELSSAIKTSSLCGLGQRAPNPVLTTLKYFRNEYIEHIEQKKCRAGVCRDLIRYTITDACTGCTACSKVCPVQSITGARKQRHEVNDALCIRCGRCKMKCRFNAINVE